MFQQHGFGNSFRLSSLFHNLATLLDLHIDDNSQGSVVWSNDLVGNTLHCASTHALRELKYRAHIAVPGSYTLLGVSDEWGCLREGEIYATVQDERTGLYKPIEGPVVITRSPQVHPGDLQFVTAVRRPELSHLTNVVVFSCEGDRSLASCLAGGDLDGDDFNLILDEALFPEKVAMPGAYDSLPIKQTTSPCGISDVVDFVMNYIESDLIGYISILHLRFADIKDPGCNECLKLAQFASHAVDYPKTGSPVKMQDLPQLPGKERPDFLAREGANLQGEDFYQSQKLLGKLYRRVPVSEWIPVPWNRDYSPSDGGVIRDTLMRFNFRQLDLPSLDTPSDDLIEEMGYLLEDYSEQLLVIAKTHTISRHKDIYVSEAELVSGTIMANWSDHRKRREAIGAMNLQTQVLAKNIRQALQWSDPDSYYDDKEGYEEDYEEYDEGDYYSKAASRNESFRRAWAAWQVAEEALNEDPGIFGPQSFGLIALTRMLDIIKEAQEY
ncbi:hypothetical protein SERLADRAFT_478899 [Serpula lacrymans var. lacrymans S7.9]|uniref:RNA-dependent RNA polymerase n=1 Tax=Serpula lacrymans var. lacrymans (strain S7.9) TaxID=578457 RepID=F8PB22_SERL9|nr:uncharacterized protein SERLADRAFT_478899 [Serpula lacrymans var. lacrymans S7.9]EGO19462.1 hypothetical protein SERLADRAFT_478899 [Serpula lacrymans var. lacrymans S7.9]